MATTLQIVNPDDTTQVLFDCNDPSSTNSALYGSVQTDLMSDVDLGSAKAENNSDGSALAFNRSASADVHFRLRMRGTSYDNMNKAIGTLSYYLSQGCVMKWVPNGSSKTSYIDVLPSPTPVLLHGQELALYQATQLFDSPEGAELQIKRLGYVRRAGLTAATNVLPNPTLLRDGTGDTVPDFWNKVSTPTLTYVSASESLHSVSGAASRGITSNDTATAGASVGQVWTISAEIKMTSGAVELGIDWRNAANANISTSTGGTSSSTSWVRVSLTATAPATTDHMRAIVQSSGAAATFDVRNVQLELASSASDFRVGPETLQVDPAASGFAQLMPIYNPSEAPAPCEVLVAFPDSSSKIVEVDYGLVSDKAVVGSRALSDFLNGPNYAQAESTGGGWTVTLGTNTASTADANASGGNVARVTGVVTESATPLSRVKWTRTTTLDSIRGRYKVYARVKGSTTIAFNMQLHWGAGTVAGETNDAVVHDLGVTGTPLHYVYMDLGDIELPLERNIVIGQLTLELWTWLDLPDSVATFDIDHIALVPVDDSAIATTALGSASETVGSLLNVADRLGAPASDPVFSAGSNSGSAKRLNAVDEATGWGSISNGLYTGVTNVAHLLEFDINTHWGGGGAVTYLCELANLTDNTIDATMSGGGTSGRKTLRMVVPDVNAKKYQPRVRITARTAPAFVDVEAIRVSSITYVPQNAKIRSDPGSLSSRAAVEQVDSSGNLGLAMNSTGTPFWIPPGLSLLWVNVFDLPTIGYNENKSDLTSGAKRTMTVTPTVYPRYWA